MARDFVRGQPEAPGEGRMETESEYLGFGGEVVGVGDWDAGEA